MPEARSLGLGKTLTQAVIEAAERGYSALFLDTLPTMATAASLYERMGFRRIGLNTADSPGTIFMKLDLANWRPLSTHCGRYPANVCKTHCGSRYQPHRGSDDGRGRSASDRLPRRHRRSRQ